jgi:hypothetical protein
MAWDGALVGLSMLEQPKVRFPQHGSSKTSIH